MNKPKAIVILSPGFPRDENDSTCLPDRQAFVKALQEYYPDFKILVFTFQYPFSRNQYKWNEITVFPFNGRNKGKLFRIFTWIKVWIKLLSIHRSYKITGMLSFWLGECAMVGKLFSRKYSLKHYCWLLGQDARPGNKYFNYIKPKGFDLIAISDFIADEFFKNYLVKPGHIIPLAIESNASAKMELPRTIDIIGVGSLIGVKQYSLFLQIIKKLLDFHQVLNVKLVGKGPEFTKLKTMAGELLLNPYVELTGELSHTEVIQLMNRSKILLHTSLYEGFGAVFSEALYAGAYVVSFCKPMGKPINRFLQVNSAKEALEILSRILNCKTPDHKSIQLYKLQEVTSHIMALFAN